MNYWPRVCWLRPSIFHKCRPNLATNNKVSIAKWSSNRSLFCFLLKQKWNEISTNLPVCLWCTHYWPRVWRLRHSTFHKCWPKFWQLKIKFQMQMQAQTWIYFVFFWNKNTTNFIQSSSVPMMHYWPRVCLLRPSIFHKCCRCLRKISKFRFRHGLIEKPDLHFHPRTARCFSRNKGWLKEQWFLPGSYDFSSENFFWIFQ